MEEDNEVEEEDDEVEVVNAVKFSCRLFVNWFPAGPLGPVRQRFYHKPSSAFTLASIAPAADGSCCNEQQEVLLSRPLLKLLLCCSHTPVPSHPGP